MGRDVNGDDAFMKLLEEAYRAGAVSGRGSDFRGWYAQRFPMPQPEDSSD